MRTLVGEESMEAERYLQEATLLARQATCEDAQCGAVIVKDGEIVGRGFNAPPAGTKHTRCSIPKTAYHVRVTDKTCCVHAEVHAIMDALRQNPEKLTGATLYFIRVDGQGEKQPAGEPYCTLCSKLVLDMGIQTFVLWHEEGIVSYQSDEYNELSFAYGAKRDSR